MVIFQKSLSLGMRGTMSSKLAWIRLLVMVLCLDMIGVDALIGNRLIAKYIFFLNIKVTLHNKKKTFENTN